MNDRERLILVYRQALFRVFDPEGEFVMTVDVPCPGLQRCHHRHGVASSLFITAWNPGSVVLDDEANAVAQDRLREDIRQGGYQVLPGQGDDPAGAWRGEPSFLVLGIDNARARMLCRRYGQLAVVFAGSDAVPRLVMQDGADRHSR